MRIETFALFFGMVYLAAGLLGLNPAALLPAPADAPPTRFGVLYGYLFGVFPVNVLHSAVHIALGAWAILAWRRIANPRVFARAAALLLGVLALAGLIPGLNTLFGLLPLHGHDIWLHAASAAIAAYFAWRPEVAVERRAGPATDRREQQQRVEQDRRRGHADRRLPSEEI